MANPDKRDIEQWFEEFVDEMEWNHFGHISYIWHKHWDGANEFKQFIIRKLERGVTDEL